MNYPLRSSLQLLGALALVLCTVAPGARADDEAANRAYVRASEWGSFYAKSVPSAAYGTEGRTQVYRVVAEGPDELLHRYEWYAPELFLEGFLGTNDVYVAQLGPSPRGHEAPGGAPGDRVLQERQTAEVVLDTRDRGGSD